MSDLKIEKKIGKVAMTDVNLFRDSITDMIELEYWEDRLDQLGEPYIIAFSENSKGKIVYYIFCNVKRVGSCFK